MHHTLPRSWSFNHDQWQWLAIWCDPETLKQKKQKLCGNLSKSKPMRCKGNKHNSEKSHSHPHKTNFQIRQHVHHLCESWRLKKKQLWCLPPQSSIWWFPATPREKKPGVKAFCNKNQHVQTANQAKEREVVMRVPCVARTSTSNPLINQ